MIARGAIRRRRRRRNDAPAGSAKAQQAAVARRRSSTRVVAPQLPEFVPHPALRGGAGPGGTGSGATPAMKLKSRRHVSSKNKRELLRQIKERKRTQRIDFNAVRSMLSPSQVAELQRLFAECDVDESGFLMGRAEISTMLQKVGLPVSELAVAEVLELADCDSNSALDFEEFLLFIVRKMSSPYSTEDVEGLFSLFDSDGSGLVSLAEFAEALETLLDGKVPQAELQVVRDMIGEMASFAEPGSDHVDYAAFAHVMTDMPRGAPDVGRHIVRRMTRDGSSRRTLATSFGPEPEAQPPRLELPKHVARLSSQSWRSPRATGSRGSSPPSPRSPASSGRSVASSARSGPRPRPATDRAPPTAAADKAPAAPRPASRAGDEAAVPTTPPPDFAEAIAAAVRGPLRAVQAFVDMRRPPGDVRRASGRVDLDAAEATLDLEQGPSDLERGDVDVLDAAERAVDV